MRLAVWGAVVPLFPFCKINLLLKSQAMRWEDEDSPCSCSFPQVDMNFDGFISGVQKKVRLHKVTENDQRGFKRLGRSVCSHPWLMPGTAAIETR